MHRPGSRLVLLVALCASGGLLTACADERTRAHRRALALAEAGDYDGAVAAASRYEPHASHLLNDLGVRFDKRGKADAALATYRAASRADPPFALPLVNFGWSLQRRGDFKGAIEAYREALRREAAFPMAHNNLGIILIAQGDDQGAIDHLRAALATPPMYFPEAHAYANFNLGRILERGGDARAALGHYRAALRIKPDLDGLAEAVRRVEGAPTPQ